MKFFSLNIQEKLKLNTYFKVESQLSNNKFPHTDIFCKNNFFDVINHKLKTNSQDENI